MEKKALVDHTSQKEENEENVFTNFLLNTGLYQPIEITVDNTSDLADLIGGKERIDIYCPECKAKRIFYSESISYEAEDAKRGLYKRPLEEVVRSKVCIYPNGNPFTEFPEEDYRLMVFKFFCSKDEDHHLDYIVLTQGNKMIKIGQYPSVADLSFPELKEYRKVMQKEDEKELKRAIGLFASGILHGTHT